MVIWYKNMNGLRLSKFVVAEMARKRRKKKDFYLGDDNMGTKLEVVVNKIKTGGVDVGCLSETNVAWEQKTARKAATMMVKRWLERTARLVTATSKVKTGSAHKPGGNGILIEGTWDPYIRKSKVDSTGMGRWVSVTLQGKKDRKLTIITAYRVCHQNEKYAGEQTAFMQQYGMMRAMGIQQPNTRGQLIKDLQKEIVERRRKMRKSSWLSTSTRHRKKGRQDFGRTWRM